MGKKASWLFAAMVGLLLVTAVAQAQVPLPKVTIGVEQAKDPKEVSQTLQILLLMTILALAPSILIMMTSFTRIIIVFHFMRSALGTQSAPPNQILVGLALFLTFFIMRPVINEVNTKALQPYLNKNIGSQAAWEAAEAPIKQFMLKHTKDKELELFIALSGEQPVTEPSAVKFSTVIPAFIISELKVAFQIGFLVYLPMILIDVIVASVLLSMGMMMLPPMMISMPLKILLFVLVDGWYLIVESLVQGFR
jgi:flagellar biosynthetic protein FliP